MLAGPFHLILIPNTSEVVLWIMEQFKRMSMLASMLFLFSMNVCFESTNVVLV